MGMDTINIEDFAELVKSSFVKFWTNFIWANLSAALPWLNAPIVGDVVFKLIEQGVLLVGTKGGLIAFMINTKVFTLDQAKDYLEAITKLNSLPDGISDEEWEKLENEADRAFANLINLAR